MIEMSDVNSEGCNSVFVRNNVTNEHGITTFGIPFVRKSVTNRGHFITSLS